MCSVSFVIIHCFGKTSSFYKVFPPNLASLFYATDVGGKGAKKRSHVKPEDDGNDQVAENAHTRDEGNIVFYSCSLVVHVLYTCLLCLRKGSSRYTTVKTIKLLMSVSLLDNFVLDFNSKLSVFKTRITFLLLPLQSLSWRGFW